MLRDEARPPQEADAHSRLGTVEHRRLAPYFLRLCDDARLLQDGGQAGTGALRWERASCLLGTAAPSSPPFSAAPLPFFPVSSLLVHFFSFFAIIEEIGMALQQLGYLYTDTTLDFSFHSGSTCRKHMSFTGRGCEWFKGKITPHNKKFRNIFLNVSGFVANFF